MTLKQTEAEKLFEKITRHTFYKHICNKCNETIIVDVDDCERIMYDPKEVEEESIVFEYDDDEKHSDMKTMKKMVLQSSDVNKDKYKFTCPVCGEVIEVNCKELLANSCKLDGSQHKIFVMDEKETEAAREFIKNHNHSNELMNEKGRPFFSSTGQQFSYTFNPGGLGTNVSIKCEYCKKSKDITNTENW